MPEVYVSMDVEASWTHRVSEGYILGYSARSIKSQTTSTPKCLPTLNPRGFSLLTFAF